MESNKNSCLNNLEKNFGWEIRNVVECMVSNESWEEIIRQLDNALLQINIKKETQIGLNEVKSHS